MKPSTCNHNKLILEPSPYALEAGYSWPSLEKRLAATTSTGRLPASTGIKGTSSNLSVEAESASFQARLKTAFPGPLVLPGDELAYDSKCPPQSLRSWRLSGDRNAVTSDRRTIYVCAPPAIDKSVEHIKKWSQPKAVKASEQSVQLPEMQDIADYVKAFYHGMDVVLMPPRTWKFVEWTDRTKKGEYCVGLQDASGITKIRAREMASDQPFSYQLNLNDMLEALLESVPEDAYAIVMLILHDMYEDDEDDFCCGRAYGGSRIAVVSSARYHPGLDDSLALDLAHSWPASHCASYVAECLKTRNKKRKADTVEVDTISGESTSTGPLREAVKVYREKVAADEQTLSSMTGLWLSRIVKTVTHELGHCFGMEHCVYYACIMQVTASVIEDARQPPYLCPICESKVLTALEEGRSAVKKQQGSKRGRKNEMSNSQELKLRRNKALLTVCEKSETVHMYAALAAWLRTQMGTALP